MMRTLLVAATSVLAVTAVLAQSNLAEQRTALMKAQGQCVYRDMARMAKGDDPYNQAKVDECFGKLKETTAKIESVFPDSSKGLNDPKSDYIVLDKLWDNKADFEARVAKLRKDVDEGAAKATSEAGFKAAYPALREGCSGCHDAYRKKKG
jgi:cytochrome c556